MPSVSFTSEEKDFLRQLIQRASVNGTSAPEQIRVFAAVIEKLQQDNSKQDGED
jgi:hypothetical protein